MMFHNKHRFPGLISETLCRRLPAELLGDKIQYLSEGMMVQVAKFDGKAIGMELPNTLDLEVVETEPGEQGDRANAGSKPATVAGGSWLC